MKKIRLTFLFSIIIASCFAQSPNEEQVGAWYMYFFNKRFTGSQFGIQGDYQYRSWNYGGDMEQLLLRTGATFRPKNTDIVFTLGYAHITTGAFGTSKDNFRESRIYQEALLPQKVGSRFFLTHRIRYEQRWVDGQDFRTRYRYNLFVNVPLNKVQLEKKAVYVALYNEIFINGQKSIGNNRSVEIFDRNRAYAGFGYVLHEKLRIQGGWMNQTTDMWSKNQLQVSLHHNW